MPDALNTPYSGSEIDPIESEVEDSTASLSSYEIVTYPADFTLEGLASKWRKGQIEIPGFQRKFIWTLPQASKLIESFLLGLPVPALFLYVDPDSAAQQVIDGQQRLTSVVQFFNGKFKNASSTNERIFKLTGISEDSPYSGMTYEQLENQLPAAFAKLNDSVLRAFVIKQLDPTDSTSIYHIFERLNTGGSTLMGQEIRNCVYHGHFNEMLCELNSKPEWRSIYGKSEPDGRMRDVELILRCLGLAIDYSEYQKPMKDFLSKSMRRHRNPNQDELAAMSSNFLHFCNLLTNRIGSKPFHIPERLSAAKLDATFVALYGQSELPQNFKERFDTLMNDSDFAACSSLRTTDKDAVLARIDLAKKTLLA